jgi:HAD superfamily hydrolase (TIGR01549 family)
MKYKIISFDLQATLSSGKFSDEFWIETLPKLYSKHYSIGVDDSKKELKQLFKEFGKYDFRYYSQQYWFDKLKVKESFNEIISLMKNKPIFFDDTKKIIETLYGKIPMIIISTTTREFIDVEMGQNQKFFLKTFSTIDDLKIVGKPKKAFDKVCLKMGVLANEILHIGDNFEMDINNGKEAGVDTFYFDNKLSRKENMFRLREVLSL